MKNAPQNLIAALLIFSAAFSLAADPSWWRERGVTNGGAPDDFAAANAGQLKNIAVSAYWELEARLPHGAGPELLKLARSFRDGDNFTAVNIGQLKAVAKPFYDRLIAEGFAKDYPWNPAAKSDDSAAANLGQLKNVFSFELSPRK